MAFLSENIATQPPAFERAPASESGRLSDVLDNLRRQKRGYAREARLPPENWVEGATPREQVRGLVVEVQVQVEVCEV